VGRTGPRGGHVSGEVSGEERDLELVSLGDGLAELFVERPCAYCRATVSTLPQNPKPTCEACLLFLARKENALKAVRAFEQTIPPRYAWASLDAPELAQRVVPETAIAWGQRHLHEPWLTFQGGSGVGKTSLAVALLHERVRSTGIGAIVILAFRLANARIQHRAGDGEPLIVERAMRAPVLLLDDVGQELATPANPVADIIQERDAEELPTWITTGLTREEIGQRYGGGVARRLFDRARAVPLGKRTAPARPAQDSARAAYEPAARRAGDP
jgi:IstB-like ATP binding protein